MKIENSAKTFGAATRSLDSRFKLLERYLEEMKLGLGLIFSFFCSSVLAGPKADADIIGELRIIRDQGISQSDALEHIRRVYDQLEDLEVDEARLLLAARAERFKEIASRLAKRSELKPEEAVQLETDAYALLNECLAVILRTRTLAGRLEKWLDTHRKTYFFLSETYVVAAAILGAEIAFKDYTYLPYKIAGTFGIGLLAAAVAVLPALWYKSWSFRVHSESLAHEFLYSTRWQSLQSLGREIRFPLRLLNCSELLSLVRKNRPIQ